MNINLVSVFSRCAVFELQNTNCYYAPQPFEVWLDDVHQGSFATNVFSLYNLKPDQVYQLVVQLGQERHSLTFCTRPERVLLDVRQFGADCSQEDATAYLQATIEACPKGGTVYLPKGIWRTGPLFLHSDMTLYLEKGAVLLGHTDRKRYPILPGMVNEGEQEYDLGTWEGNPLDCYASLITAIHARNLVICGEGVLDGNAAASDWWEDAKVRRGAWRPRTLFLKRCEQVSVVGVTIQNSPSWTVHPHYCIGLDLLDIRVQNPDNSPNTDGIDPESCRQVRILGAVVSVGDDCISIKSGKYYMGQYHPFTSRDVLVQNCLLERGHGAVVIGSETSAGVSGVQIRQCLMRNTDRGLRVKTRRGRGNRSVVEGVVYDNVEMEHVLAPFVINMFYFCDPDGRTRYVSSKEALPVDAMTPQVKSLTVRNIRCTGAHQVAAFFYGLPEQPIGRIEMERVYIQFAPHPTPGLPAMMEDIEPMAGQGIVAVNVKQLILREVKMEGLHAEPFQLQGVEQLVKE